MSCSFKPGDDNKRMNQQTSTLETNLDSDGDGFTDEIEREKGTDPFIANVPTFKGDLFEELKVLTSLYRTSDNSTKTISFQVTKSFASENGVPAEERDFLGNGKSFLAEEIASRAKEGGFQQFHLVHGQSGLDEYIAPPRMNDSKIFPYSESLEALRSSHRYEEIEINLKSNLQFESDVYSSYSDLVFELYSYDVLTKVFSKISTDILQGTYRFNAQYDVVTTYFSNSQDLVKQISESGARFLFLKIKDFKINDNGKFYREILDSVKEKSVSLSIIEGDTISQTYVGINGIPTSIDTIFERGVKNRYLVQNSRLVQLGDKSNTSTLELNAYGESSRVENKWFLLTNEIYNNPFKFSFGVNDFISLGYVSQGEKFNLIPSYTSFSISPRILRTNKLVQLKAENIFDLRMNLKPKFYNGPVVTGKASNLCSETAQSSLCFYYKTDIQSLKGLLALPIINVINIQINSRSFKLSDLISNQYVSIRQKNSEVFELKFNPAIVKYLDSSKGITLGVETKMPEYTKCEGVKICEGNGLSCQTFFRNSVPNCDSSIEENVSLKILDKTNKSFQNFDGEAFFSIDYL